MSETEVQEPGEWDCYRCGHKTPHKGYCETEGCDCQHYHPWKMVWEHQRQRENQEPADER